MARPKVRTLTSASGGQRSVKLSYGRIGAARAPLLYTAVSRQNPSPRSEWFADLAFTDPNVLLGRFVPTGIVRVCFAIGAGLFNPLFRQTLFARSALRHQSPQHAALRRRRAWA